MSKLQSLDQFRQWNKNLKNLLGKRLWLCKISRPDACQSHESTLKSSWTGSFGHDNQRRKAWNQSRYFCRYHWDPRWMKNSCGKAPKSVFHSKTWNSRSRYEWSWALAGRFRRSRPVEEEVECKCRRYEFHRLHRGLLPRDLAQPKKDSFLTDLVKAKNLKLI